MIGADRPLLSNDEARGVVSDYITAKMLYSCAIACVVMDIYLTVSFVFGGDCKECDYSVQRRFRDGAAVLTLFTIGGIFFAAMGYTVKKRGEEMVSGSSV